MAVIYTLAKINDQYNLTVGQDSTYTIKHINSIEETISTASVIADSTTALSLTKDGSYKIEITAEGETTVVEEIKVTYNLENSIITDVWATLCGTSCTTSFSTPVIQKNIREILQNQNLFNKILTYQNLYFSDIYLEQFTEYLKKCFDTYNILIDSHIDKVLVQECIGSCDTYDKTLNSLQLFIYWAGLYFLEASLIADDDFEGKKFVKTKYKYIDITNCVYTLSFDIMNLEKIFNDIVMVAEIYSFQLDNISEDINDILNVNYNLNSYTEEQMLAGTEITYNKVARIGFIIKNKQENPYIIKDVFGINITEITFNYLYDNNISYYVSKEYITPSTLYFKFTENN